MALPSLETTPKPQFEINPDAVKARIEKMQAENLHPVAQAILDNTTTAPVKLDPSKVRWSKWGNRHQSRFIGPKFAAFVEDIRSTSGNNTPGVVRPLEQPDENGCEYEIASGHRRHRACLESGQLFNAFIRKMSDIELQVELEAENRNREDVSHIERAKQYADQLPTYRSQEHMASLMGIPTSTMGRYLQLASLSQSVLDLISNPLEITLEAGISVVQFKNKNVSLFEENLSAVQVKANGSTQPYKDVFAALKLDPQKASTTRKAADLNSDFTTSSGSVIGTMNVNRAKQLRVCIENVTPDDFDKVQEALKKIFKNRLK